MRHRISVCCLFLTAFLFFAAGAFAIPPEQIATDESITTQVIDSNRLSEVKKYPYAHMITGESLVGLLRNLADFSAEGSTIMFNRATAQLFVRATPTTQDMVEDILTDLRLNKPKQVVIEARFVEISNFEGSDLGVDITQFDYVGSKHIDTIGSMMSFAQGAWTNSNALNQANEFSLMTAIANSDFDVSAVLRALAQMVKLNTLSAPKITCLNNQRSNIRIATSKNYVEKIESDVVATTAGTTTSVDVTVDTALEGVSLDVTPSVNISEDTITLELHPSVVTVDLSDTQAIQSGLALTNNITLPKYVRQTIDTTVTIPDGGTVILGGLIKDTQKNDIRKVPFLGDVPILGNLFRFKTEYKDKTNLLIFITARIVNENGIVIGY